ncbi:PucR family transcriptional regulator [Carnobacterium sp.]|uniref:PucR family transcriptional regulator n=1 Tax=Carnobacterium sp. TaxID=48221 RepID=UPI0028AB921F|nr:PucR family transcriptional regulator [Carnobacterium sp.]
MNLTIQKILEFDSLKDASSLTGSTGLKNTVTGIMIVEGPDIESWGREGELLLSSYYALKDLSPNELNAFFKEAKRLKISGLIIKIDRVVGEIPDFILELCKENEIPLIKIPKSTQYEPILLDVMGNLINNNIHLLEKYYHLQNHFTKMALTEPELIDILFILKDLIKKPISLKNTLKNEWISTDPLYDTASINQIYTLPQKKYMNYDYIRRDVTYLSPQEKLNYTQLVVNIPNLEFTSFELIIHEVDFSIPVEDFMAIENTVSFLQMELLKKHAVLQNNLNYKNSIISDLLNDRMENKEEVIEKTTYLKLENSPNYRVLICHFSNASLDRDNSDVAQKKEHQFTLTFTEEIKKYWPQRVYLIRQNKIVFIVDTQTDDEEALKEKIAKSIQISKKKFQLNNLKMTVNFSYTGNLFHLPSLYKQAQDTQKITALFGESDVIYSYRDIGIYQLFAESNNLQHFEKYIPTSLLELNKDHPDLIETLKVFLDMNQNYKTTADALFVHPKTVRYRIDKIKQLISIDFHNAEELLQINIGLRLLKMLN